MVVAALSTGHKLGLAVVAAIFIGFALLVSFVIPARRPDFPGRNGVGAFALVAVVLFAAMLAAVTVFGRESEAKGAAKALAQQGSPGRTIKVQEKEFQILLPPEKLLPPGKYSFAVTNVGKVQHDLAISGPQVTGPARTPLISPGQSATLTVSLTTGTYTLYCAVPGHRQLGMVAKISVG